MVVSFELLDLTQPPRLILKNANDRVLGILSRATNVIPELKYNETSKLTFNLPAKVDGEDVPLYHDIAGMQIVDLQGIGQFVLMNPVETGSGVSASKSCTAYSLEYEFTRKKITIPNGTYKFWDVLNPENTILGMIMSLMPSWSIGTVPVKIANKYRTFEVSNENNYNFIKGTVQKTFNCIFDFDTYTRTVHIHDADESPANHPLYISPDNLAKSIDIKEDDESVVTRLDVSGADGVNIRDVNPNGTNKIINLDYYMTTSNFSQRLIDKYYAWKKLNEECRASYYNRTVEYAMLSTEKVNLNAKLVDLENDRISIENIQAVTIQGIAQGIQTQKDLDDINESLAEKDEEITDHKALIDNIEQRISLCFDDIQSIVNACDFESYFTEEEHIQLDRYIKDDEIAESTFVAETSAVYTDDVVGSKIDRFDLNISDSTIDVLDSVSGSYYCAKSGKVSIGDMLEGDIILATVDIISGISTVSLYLHNARYQGKTYLNACVSITGYVTSAAEASQNPLSALELTFENGYIYFSVNISEFGKRSVAWDLFEYGCAILDKVSKPTYTFSITSANFLIEEQFESFRKTLKLGERVFIPLSGNVMNPICIGVTWDYGNPESLELLFSDSYISGESQFKLVDLLEQSVSMGKKLDVGQYTYSQFTDSGASSGIKKFMTSALDTSKNAILSSTGQAVSWDGAGIRLRKWTDDSKTAYDNEQIWINNNSILLTADNWKTAQMAIGKFHDKNLGDCWGVVAPMLVGTILAGSSLVIESAKQDGNTAVFRVDEDGCHLYNSNFAITNNNTSILINPDVGIVLGDIGAYSIDDHGTYSIDEDKAKFWVDENGELHIKGSGRFDGSIYATDLHIGKLTAQEYVEDVTTPLITEATEPIINSVNAKPNLYYQNDPPKAGYKVGDFWRDKNSPYGYLYIAIANTGDPGADWMMVSSQVVEGARIDLDTNAGTIDIAAASTVNLSGGILSIAGSKALNLSSTGGVNILGSDVAVHGKTIKLLTSDSVEGVLTLGSEHNKLTSSGVLSLANGNILLDGPNNVATIGNGNGTVNIGTSGNGVINIGTGGTATINLATYNIKSDTKSTAYDAAYSVGGTASSADNTKTVTYTKTDDDGVTSAASFTITMQYTSAAITEHANPSITDGKLLQLVYQNKGLSMYADTANNRTILAPSVSDGNLLGWNVISAINVGATNMSTDTFCAKNMYLNGIAVADQKWTIDTIADVLNNNDVIPGIKSRADSAYYGAYRKPELILSESNGMYTLSVKTAGGESEPVNFNSAASGSLIFTGSGTSIIAQLMKKGYTNPNDSSQVLMKASAHLELNGIYAEFRSGANAGGDLIASIDCTPIYDEGKTNGKTDGANSLELYAGGYSGVADLDYGESVSILASTTRGDGTTNVESILVKAPVAPEDRFDDGVESVTITSVSAGGAGSPTVTDNVATANVIITAKASNDKTLSEMKSIDVTNVWNAVEILQADIVKESEFYQNSTHDTIVTVRATATNGATKTNALRVEGDQAFASGRSDGWTSAYGQVLMPSAGTEKTFTITIPAATLDGTAQVRTFTMTKGSPSSSGGYAAVSYNNSVVARIDISDWWTAGVNAGANSLDFYAGGYTSFVDLEYGKSISVIASTTRGDGTTKVESILVKAPADRFEEGVKSVTLSKSWSNSVLTVKASNDEKETAQLTVGEGIWSGLKYSADIYDGSTFTGLTCEVDASTIYEDGEKAGYELGYEVGEADGWGLGYADAADVLEPRSIVLVDYSEPNRSVYVNVQNQYGENLLSEAQEVSAIDIYKDGYDDGADTLSLNVTEDIELDYGVSETIIAATIDSKGNPIEKSVIVTAPKNNYGTGYNDGYDDGKPTSVVRTGYDTEKQTVTVTVKNSKEDALTGQPIDASEIYAAGREAVEIRQADMVRENDDYYEYSTHDTIITIRATATNGASRYKAFRVEGDKAYANGVSDGEVTGAASVGFSSFSASGGVITPMLTNDKTTTYYCAAGTADSSHKIPITISMYQNGTGGKQLMTVDASSVFSNGVNSVVVSNDSIVRQTVDEYIGGENHSTNIYIKAQASNGNYGNQTFSVSGETAYNAGWAAAVKACSASRTDDTVTVVMPSSTVGSTTKKTFTATASISNHSDSYTASKLIINGTATTTGGYYTNAQVSYTPSSHSHNNGSAVITWS